MKNVKKVRHRFYRKVKKMCKLQLQYKKDKSGDCTIQSLGYIGEEKICQCVCHTNNGGKEWVIAKWFVDSQYQRKGYGYKILKKTLQELFMFCSFPEKISYIWNGTNEYVMEWLLEKFDAQCSCPIAVQKTQSEDDWESHIYQLDISKTLEYFDIRQ